MRALPRKIHPLPGLRHRPRPFRFAASSMMPALPAFGGLIAFLASRNLMRGGGGSIPELVISVILEESMKALATLGISILFMAAKKVYVSRVAGGSGSTPRERRFSRRAIPEAGMRGLGLGIVASAAFACAENFSYSLAFPVAGLFWRLWWNIPLHILCSTLVAGGLVLAIRRVAGEKETAASHAALRAGLSFSAACLVHILANIFISSGPSSFGLTAASMALAPSTIAIFIVVSRILHSGGTIHETRY